MLPSPIVVSMLKRESSWRNRFSVNGLILGGEGVVKCGRSLCCDSTILRAVNIIVGALQSSEQEIVPFKKNI
jgi:hypothetical protein